MVVKEAMHTGQKLVRIPAVKPRSSTPPPVEQVGGGIGYSDGDTAIKGTFSIVRLLYIAEILDTFVAYISVADMFGD
jgi:hypothetical protein